MIGILNMDMGNLRSAYNAVYENGGDPVIIENPATLDEVSHLIIPGVGHFGTAMEHLGARGLTQPILAFAESGRPLMGICLGMQLLTETGTEGGEVAGLGIIPGSVRRMNGGGGLRVPHVGWNRVRVKRDHPLMADIKPDRDCYFVHSYAMVCDDPTDVIAETDYGGAITCAVGRGNVVGVQFHPEKSQSNGLKMLENFCEWDGKC